MTPNGLEPDLGDVTFKASLLMYTPVPFPPPTQKPASSTDGKQRYTEPADEFILLSIIFPD